MQPYQLYQLTAQMQPYQLYQFTAQLQSSQLHNAALLTQYPVALLLSPTVDFPSTLLSSVPNAPRCFQPTFTRRTSGRSKETWRAHICLFRRVTVLIVVIIIIIIIVIITATGVMTLWWRYDIDTVTFASVCSIVSWLRLCVWATVTDMGGIRNWSKCLLLWNVSWYCAPAVWHSRIRSVRQPLTTNREVNSVLKFAQAVLTIIILCFINPWNMSVLYKYPDATCWGHIAFP